MEMSGPAIAIGTDFCTDSAKLIIDASGFPDSFLLDSIIRDLGRAVLKLMPRKIFYIVLLTSSRITSAWRNEIVVLPIVGLLAPLDWP